MRLIFKPNLFFLIVVCFAIGCNSKKNIDSKSIKKELSDFDNEVMQSIKKQLGSSNASFTILADSVTLDYVDVVNSFYSNSDFVPIWVDADSVSPRTIEFVRFLDTSIYVGLFKNDYQFAS
jgi:hypothetical protein